MEGLDEEGGGEEVCDEEVSVAGGVMGEVCELGEDCEVGEVGEDGG
jgi:hypothetical protein